MDDIAVRSLSRCLRPIFGSPILKEFPTPRGSGSLITAPKGSALVKGQEMGTLRTWRCRPRLPKVLVPLSCLEWCVDVRLIGDASLFVLVVGFW